MSSWKDIANGNLDGARLSAREGEFRSCVSRAYYAAFAAVAFALRAYAPFASGRETPQHLLVPKLMQQHLASTTSAARLRELKARMRRLYNERINADYKSAAPIDAHSALQSRRDASAVCKELGVRNARSD